jgi:predicted PurR-regulated permease PerM
MLGIDRKAARYTWTAAVVVLLLWLVYLVRSTLFIFVLAVLFAYLLSPLVNLIDRVLPSDDRARTRTRTPALALAYIIFVGVTVFLVMQIGSTVVSQAKAFQQDLPNRIAKFEEPNPSLPSAVNNFKAELIQKIRVQVTEGASDMVSTMARAGLKAITVASDAIFVVIIPILAFFFLKEGQSIRQQILDFFDDGPRRELIHDVLADVHVLLAQYMRALVVLSVATFIAYSVFFAAMGVPYGVLLAAIAAVLEFIPMIGPLSSGVVIVLVSLISGSHGLAVLIFLLVYRVFQDYVLQPHLMGQGVEVHPLLVIFGVFAGGEVGGIAGTFLSVPILALARIVYIRMSRVRAASRVSPTGALRP